MSDDQQSLDARRLLAAIPGFSRRAAEAAKLTRLKGLTNTVFKVEVGGRNLCLRVPGAGTAAIIDRRVEERNARAAEAAGVAPAVLYFGPDGVMLTAFIEGAATLAAAAFRARPGATERVAEALRRLHQKASPFARDFRVFDIVDEYVAILEAWRGGVLRPGARDAHPPGARGSGLADQIQAALDAAAGARAALAANPARPRPCHCDPTGGNLLDTGERVILVDWEYSGMNDPAWDLAYLSLEGDFDEAHEQRLLQAYFERPPTAAEHARVAIHKPLCQLLSAAWALIQHANGNRAADFSGYAQARLARCMSRLRSRSFEASVKAVSAG